MPALILSIIGASATAVGKVLFIGLIGSLACKFPKGAPILPSASLPVVSRMVYNMLMLPLIYTGIASSVRLEDLKNLYPIVLISWGILVISYTVTMCIGYLPCFSMHREPFFVPLCIASTFANIVAFPIIVFPILCEYGVVQDLVREDVTGDNDEEVEMDEQELYDICMKQTNVIVFTYFLGFSLVLWSFGCRTLVNLRKSKKNDQNDTVTITNSDQPRVSILQRGCTALKKFTLMIKEVSKDIITSTEFQALLLGLVTVCIKPLQGALFDVGGWLRAIGSGLESLSDAATTFAIIIVAATLMKIEQNAETNTYDRSENDENQTNESEEALRTQANVDQETSDENEEKDEIISVSEQLHMESTTVSSMPIITKEENLEEPGHLEVETSIGRMDQNTSHEDSKKSKRNCLLNGSLNCFTSIPRKTMNIYIWQITARLFVTPGIVFILLISLDCYGLLESVPNISKLVLLLNSSAPGALVVVVILKVNGLTEEAEAVSKTYLPAYTLSILTYAMWSIVGLIAFRQESDIC